MVIRSVATVRARHNVLSSTGSRWLPSYEGSHQPSTTSPLSSKLCTYVKVYTENVCIKFESDSISRCGGIELDNAGFLNLTGLAKGGGSCQFRSIDSVTPRSLNCLKVRM